MVREAFISLEFAHKFVACYERTIASRQFLEFLVKSQNKILPASPTFSPSIYFLTPSDDGGEKIFETSYLKLIIGHFKC